MKDEIYEEVSLRLGDYKCDGQLSLFDITQDEQFINEPDVLPVEDLEVEVLGQMSIFDFMG